jgi:hypothetical protein
MPARLTASLLFVLVAGAAWAQPSGGSEPARFSVWGGLTLTPSAEGGALATDYEPVLQGASGYTSRASQTLNVDLGGGTGLIAGADIFFSRRVGLQAAFTYRRAGLTGPANGNYQFSLLYVARQPPDYEPRDYVIERAEPWPDTAGRCSLRSFQLGVVVRAGPAAGRIEATFAGGVGLNGAEADIESVGYTQFRLGGHGVLFESQDRVAISTAGSGTFARPYLAGDVGIRAGRRAWLFAGVRAQLGTAPALKARPARVVDPEGSLWEPDSAELEQVLTMAPLRLAMPHWQVVAGLRVAIR